MWIFVCRVCVWARERVTSAALYVCVRVCWVCERESKRSDVCVCVCVCVCVRVCAQVCERERDSHTTAACVQTHSSFITVSVTRLCSPLGLELMVKLRTLLTIFTFILKDKARNYGKGRYISDVACVVRPITMLCARWPIRADCACRKEGLCRKRSVWERQGMEGLQ